ncbi:DUF695 domain-containing protein [Dyadobacter jiangsuensis]
MGLIKGILGIKSKPIQNNEDFWRWFVEHERKFFKAVESGQNIEKSFFNKLSEKLDEMRDGYFYLAGMYNDNTAELILTADGNVKNIVFVEELIRSAPQLAGWKFTALKPPTDIQNVSISMAGLEFRSDNLFFYANELSDYPDEIDVSIVHIHSDMTEENREQIIRGAYIFLENYLGEKDFVNSIDNLRVIGENEADNELVPVAKLKDFLLWREKEFVEKYEGIRYDTNNDEHSILEAKLENGTPLLAVINSKLLAWDRQASHPWIAIITINYDGSQNNGLPNSIDYGLMNEIEDEIMLYLIDSEGFLNVGRQTVNNERDIYFACKDFRRPSKIFDEIQRKHHNSFKIQYDIFKDKYWQTFDRFRRN